MDTVIMLTIAYNAEKTLRRCVDSVLNQTYPELIYYLVDNGSTDKTREIIQEYAKKDNRVKPLFYDENSVLRFFPLFYMLLEQHKEGFFVNLDADDEYDVHFLEKALRFMQEKDLDMVACGSELVSGTTDKLLEKWTVQENLVLFKEGFGEYYPSYYHFMNTVWGKLYSIELLRKCNFNGFDNIATHGADAMFAMEVFRVAERVGILSGTLHTYYRYPQSAASVFNEQRLEFGRIRLKSAYDYLISKCEHVSEENKNHLHCTYLGYNYYTLHSLIGTQMCPLKKFKLFLRLSLNRTMCGVLVRVVTSARLRRVLMYRIKKPGEVNKI